jgi:GGDEF domain-containing protein
MALMSVKRYLTQMEEEAAYRKVVSMLLDCVAASALNLDQEKFESFRSRIVELRQEISAVTTVESLIAYAGEAVQAIGDFSRETSGLIHTQIDEMQKMIGTLATKPPGAGGTEVREASPPVTPRVDSPQVSAVAQEVSILKARLRASLASIRDGTAHPKPELERLAQAPDSKVPGKQEPPRTIDIDPITELPCEAAARAQFLSALHSGTQRHAVVFVLGSAQRINLRFGRAAGDEILRELKRYVAGQLQPGDRMFRWPGPAVVALLAGTEQFDRVRTRMKRFLEKPIEREFDINGRSVLIPLSIAWSVFPVALPLAGLNRQIHDFIASQGYRDEDPVPA